MIADGTCTTVRNRDPSHRFDQLIRATPPPLRSSARGTRPCVRRPPHAACIGGHYATGLAHRGDYRTTSQTTLTVDRQAPDRVRVGLPTLIRGEASPWRGRGGLAGAAHPPLFPPPDPHLPPATPGTPGRPASSCLDRRGRPGAGPPHPPPPPAGRPPPPPPHPPPPPPPRAARRGSPPPTWPWSGRGVQTPVDRVCWPERYPSRRLGLRRGRTAGWGGGPRSVRTAVSAQ